MKEPERNQAGWFSGRLFKDEVHPVEGTLEFYRVKRTAKFFKGIRKMKTEQWAAIVQCAKEAAAKPGEGEGPKHDQDVIVPPGAVVVSESDDSMDSDAGPRAWRKRKALEAKAKDDNVVRTEPREADVTAVGGAMVAEAGTGFDSAFGADGIQVRSSVTGFRLHINLSLFGQDV